MAKSLADMPAEERAECVGMWCDLETNKGIQQVVLYKMVEDRDIGPIAYRLSFTSRHEILGFGPEDLTPRFDLPRAWTPDGQPVEMVKEYGIFYTLRDGGEEVCFVHDDPLSVEPAVKHLEKSLRRGTITKITRKTQWVTEWEEVPEPQRTNGMVNPYV